MKLLDNGESKVIGASRASAALKSLPLEVKAERIDADKPYVHLKILGCPALGEPSVILTDVDALDLIDRLQRALSTLPSSK